MIPPVVTSSGNFLINSNASALAFAIRQLLQLVCWLGYSQTLEKASLLRLGAGSKKKLMANHSWQGQRACREMGPDTSGFLWFVSFISRAN
jgi:hypothetical protein